MWYQTGHGTAGGFACVLLAAAWGVRGVVCLVGVAAVASDFITACVWRNAFVRLNLWHCWSITFKREHYRYTERLMIPLTDVPLILALPDQNMVDGVKQQIYMLTKCYNTCNVFIVKLGYQGIKHNTSHQNCIPKWRQIALIGSNPADDSVAFNTTSHNEVTRMTSIDETWWENKHKNIYYSTLGILVNPSICKLKRCGFNWFLNILCFWVMSNNIYVRIV